MKKEIRSILGLVEQGGATLMEMSNLRPEDTGIKGVAIWVSAGEFEGKRLEHGPRVKVVVGGGKVNSEALDKAPSVRIKDGFLVKGHLEGRILKQVREFLALNRDVLMMYWNQEIGTKAMIVAIKSSESK